MTTANTPLLAGFEPGWEDLFNRFADGLATADDERQLHGLLRASAAARRAYREFGSLHSSLHWDYAAVANHGMPPGGGTARGRSRTSRGRWIATLLAGAILSGAAATVAVVMMPPGLMARIEGVIAPGAAGEVAIANPTAGPLATVKNTRFLLVADAGSPLATGQPIDAGRVSILGGAVELALRNGVEILLEGPGELELIGELQAFLHAGSAVVRMPKGMHGFRLETANTEVLDLGTEFAVKAVNGFMTDVQVYDGAVLATAKREGNSGRFPKRLEAGQSVRFAPESPDEPTSLPYAEERFVRRLPVDVGIEHRSANRRDQWAIMNEIRQFGRPQQPAIVVSRPAGPIAIDGRLDDWRSSPGFTASLNRDPAAAEWVDGRMMYDDEHLYIAAHVGDPCPLSSSIDPVIDADDGWRGGAVQVRLSTDRSQGWPVNANSPNYYKMRRLEAAPQQRKAAFNPRLAHLTMWFHAASATPCLTIAHGMMLQDLQVNPSGFRAAYTRDADGLGYVMEYAIPWRLLHCETDPPQPGDDLAAAWQVLYSDEGGRLWRTQILEVRNPDEPPKIFFWERAATWGRAEYR
jgi:hypothetical protein